MPAMPRIQAVVLPILRGHETPGNNKSTLPGLEGVKVGSWVEDIDYRDFPIINIRRIGGPRNGKRPKKFALSVIEMTAYGTEGLVETENLYEDALEALYDAVLAQTQVSTGYLHSIKETMGATEFGSPFQDSWRIQGLIQLGVRPPRP